MPFNELLPALARGELDLVMSGVSITPARQQQVDFTRSYQQVGQMAIIRTADVMRFRHPSSLYRGGFRVGFERDTTGADYVKADLGNATAVPFDNAEQGLQALLEQRIDVLIHDAATSWYIATEPKYGELMGLYRPLTEEYLAWAVNKNNPQLREQLDRELESMRHSGVLEHIRNRWIPVRISVGE
jgi:ABC-type amino acid transport substrate-binding protein